MSQAYRPRIQHGVCDLISPLYASQAIQVSNDSAFDYLSIRLFEIRKEIRLLEVGLVQMRLRSHGGLL